jgi:hypothetical protein
MEAWLSRYDVYLKNAKGKKEAGPLCIYSNLSNLTRSSFFVAPIIMYGRKPGLYWTYWKHEVEHKRFWALITWCAWIFEKHLKLHVLWSWLRNLNKGRLDFGRPLWGRPYSLIGPLLPKRAWRYRTLWHWCALHCTCIYLWLMFYGKEWIFWKTLT